VKRKSVKQRSVVKHLVLCHLVVIRDVKTLRSGIENMDQGK
jgi:hypothetical protein